MFIKDNSLIDIKIYWKKIKNRYEAYSEREFKKLNLKEDEKKKFTPLNLKALELTWELFNQLQDDAMEDSGAEKRWSFKRYKESRLKKLFREWDAKNDKGEPVPLIENTLMHLAPPIAEAMLRGYDEIAFISEDEEKNL